MHNFYTLVTSDMMPPKLDQVPRESQDFRTESLTRRRFLAIFGGISPDLGCIAGEEEEEEVLEVAAEHRE